MNFSISEAHNQLSRLLNQAHKGPVFITRRGKPVVVIITSEEYEFLRRARAYLQMASLSHNLRASGLTASELYRAARHELEDNA